MINISDNPGNFDKWYFAIRGSARMNLRVFLSSILSCTKHVLSLEGSVGSVTHGCGEQKSSPVRFKLVAMQNSLVSEMEFLVCRGLFLGKRFACRN